MCENQKMFGSEPCELCELQPTTLSLFSMLQPPGLQVNSSTLRGSVLAGSCAQNCNNSKQFQRMAFVMRTKAFNDGHLPAQMQYCSFSEQERGCLFALGCVGSRFLTALVFSPTCM